MNPFLTNAQVEELNTMGYIELTDELLSVIFNTTNVVWENDILVDKNYYQ
jgi:hypothetical protein